jgi:multimeric flavodoxin WrbA
VSVSADKPLSGAPRVLLIAGSPRRNGNSDRLLDALARGAESAGGLVVRVAASEVGANPCRGCNACSKDGRCIQRDGMDDLYAAIDAADAVAVATPVFFATVPAVLKIVFDRFQPYWARRYVLGEPKPAVKRPGAILVVGGGGDPYGPGCATVAVKSAFSAIAVSSETVLEVVGPDSPGDIDLDPDALHRAETIGSGLVEQARGQL